MIEHNNRLLIRGARVYDHDGDVAMPATADILIEGGDIVKCPSGDFVSRTNRLGDLPP